MLKSLLFSFFFFTTLVMADDGTGIKLVNGVSCGIQSEPDTEVVKVGSISYLYDINDLDLSNQELNLNLKLEFFYCTKHNSEYEWIAIKPSKTFLSSLQKAQFENGKWIIKGYSQLEKISTTNEEFVYQVNYKSIPFEKFLTKEEYQSYTQGKKVTAYLKLDIYSKTAGKNVGSFMVLKLNLSKQENTLEVL